MNRVAVTPLMQYRFSGFPFVVFTFTLKTRPDPLVKKIVFEKVQSNFP